MRHRPAFRAIVMNIAHLLFISFVFTATALSAATEKPNIIFILADDMGYGDAGCYGQKTLATPNIDRMAAEGMKFTRHYAGCTVCAPSRCVLMTGLHTGHCRVRGNGPGLIPDTDWTVPKQLKAAGYTTACFGKYGLGLPLPEDDPKRKGFDEFYGYVDTAHAHNCYTTFLVQNGERVPLNNKLLPGAEKMRSEGMGVAAADGRKQWAPQLIAEEMQKFLRVQADAKQPFFLYYALNLPHANDEAKEDSPLGHGMESPSYGEFTARDWPDSEKGFASIMRFVDNEVGAVLATLKKLGLDESTVVFFSSDNGPHQEGGHHVSFFQSNDGLTGMKRDLTEGGVREPFIARWPGKISPGSETAHISGFVDFLATCADLSGTAVNAETDGISYLPTLLGKNEDQRKHPYLFWNFREQGGKRSVLKWPWKLIHLNTGEMDPGQPKAKQAKSKPLAVELYNLDSDPAEGRNVAADNPKIVAELEGLVKEAWKAP
jgi:arylsulfatase A-like enzyme